MWLFTAYENFFSADSHMRHAAIINTYSSVVSAIAIWFCFGRIIHPSQRALLSPSFHLQIVWCRMKPSPCNLILTVINDYSVNLQHAKSSQMGWNQSHDVWLIQMTFLCCKLIQTATFTFLETGQMLHLLRLATENKTTYLKHHHYTK